MKFERNHSLLFAALAILMLTGLAGMTLNSTAAQRPTAQCPKVTVVPPLSVQASATLQLTADIRGGDPAVTPKYSWTISAGKISSGQGTSVITIDSSDVGGMHVTTVVVGGFDERCDTTASTTVEVTPRPQATKMSEYSPLNSEAGQEKLVELILALVVDPTAKGYIVAYGGSRADPGEALAAGNDAKHVLLKDWPSRPERLVVIDGGFRDEATIELWFVPDQAAPPKPTPSIKSDR